MASENIKSMNYSRRPHAKTPRRKVNLGIAIRNEIINPKSSLAFSASLHSKGMLRLGEGLFLIIPFLLLLSCQSVPKGASAFLHDSNYAPLDSGASVYIFADVTKARSIIELLPFDELNDKQVKQMLDKTGFITAGIFPEETKRHFQLVTWGKYPGNANMAFSVNKNWKKQRNAVRSTYWYSGAQKLSIAINKKQVFAASWLHDNPMEPFSAEPGIKIPDGFNSFRRGQGTGAPLSCWINNPGPIISRVMNDAGIPLRFPIQQLYLNLFTLSGEQYEAVIRFQLESALQARGMATILALAGSFAVENILTSIFLANPPVQNENNIDIKTAPLSKNELSLLLEMFSLY